ncbi:MAG TPA: Gfo/Idh/MocA family oxidoreductase [Gemmataceae bacterium]|nr:Gfo/Idh/MocA family oxidoreductase [Gemmataceae bacterium]
MSDTVNRRDFLAAGAAVASTLTLSSRLFAAGDSSINVGVIGCGGRGSGALRNVLDADREVRVAALCDLNESKVKNTYANLKKRQADRLMAKEENCYHGLDGFKKLLELSDVNYVILATPPGFRPYHLEAAVAAGKNVFTEKPVAVDVAGVRKCLDVAKQAQAKGLKIAAGTQRRHQAGYIETMKRLHDGEFGDVLSGRVYWNGTTPWFNARPKGMRDTPYQLYNWYHFLWLCGDHIVEQHVHNLDVANWAMNATPVKATGMGGRSNRPVGDPKDVGHIFDHFAIEYEYPNGVVVQSYCRQIDGCANNISEDFIGTKARVHTSPGNYIANGKEIIGGAETDPYVQEHIDLIKAIRDNKPMNELEQVTNSTFTAILGRMSTYSGKALKWDDVLHGVTVRRGGKQVHEEPWFEDTMPKDLSLDVDVPVDPTPVVGQWKPKQRA